MRSQVLLVASVLLVAWLPLWLVSELSYAWAAVPIVGPEGLSGGARPVINCGMFQWCVGDGAARRKCCAVAGDGRSAAGHGAGWHQQLLGIVACLQ
ncbi:unnamed protein product [Gongylonema pulchrum]|uniref:Secreted protein n=1 Tax=Gongylonema pulchrum TaxID=637853 RepID=A0A183E2L3_9BILA|nr:unnamed protein product [Gongylonema pulchrum]